MEIPSPYGVVVAAFDVMGLAVNLAWLPCAGRQARSS